MHATQRVLNRRPGTSIGPRTHAMALARMHGISLDSHTLAGPEAELLRQEEPENLAITASHPEKKINANVYSAEC